MDDSIRNCALGFYLCNQVMRASISDEQRPIFLKKYQVYSNLEKIIYQSIRQNSICVILNDYDGSITSNVKNGSQLRK